MPTFLVTWEINLSAKDAVSAAREAKKIQTDPNSRANVFKVFDGEDREESIDLDEEV